MLLDGDENVVVDIGSGGGVCWEKVWEEGREGGVLKVNQFIDVVLTLRWNQGGGGGSSFKAYTYTHTTHCRQISNFKQIVD